MLKRFPGATPEQIVEAHAYTNGGAITGINGVIESESGDAARNASEPDVTQIGDWNSLADKIFQSTSDFHGTVLRLCTRRVDGGRNQHPTGRGAEELITRTNSTNAFNPVQRVKVLRDPNLPAVQRTVQRWFDTSALAARYPSHHAINVRSTNSAATTMFG